MSVRNALLHSLSGPSRGRINQKLKPGLHDIGLLFMQDRFPESATKTHPSMSVYTERENSPLTLFRAKIISLRLPYLLFSLSICQIIDQLHLH